MTLPQSHQEIMPVHHEERRDLSLVMAWRACALTSLSAMNTLRVNVDLPSILSTEHQQVCFGQRVLVPL